MGRMSKRKGAVGEREAAEKLNEVLGTKFRRGRQYCGGPESPDLVGDLPGLHVEVKRCERLRLYEALSQAERDASGSQVPVVMHRSNRKPWVVVVAADYLIRLLDVVDEARAKLEETAPGGEDAAPPAFENRGNLGPRPPALYPMPSAGCELPAAYQPTEAQREGS